MRKFLLALGVFGIVAVAGVAQADPVDTPFGSVTANEGGYVLLLDGDEGNEDPFDGYGGVNGSGIQCSDTGDGYEYTDNNEDGDTDDEGEKTASDDGCNPTP